MTHGLSEEAEQRIAEMIDAAIHAHVDELLSNLQLMQQNLTRMQDEIEVLNERVNRIADRVLAHVGKQP